MTVERPSAHAAIVHLDYGVTPAFASAVGISRSPLREWHAFATVTTPGRSGYRLLISRAGDWTGRFIDDPPSHVWVRGTPVVGADGQGRAPLRACRLRRHRQRDRAALGQILAARVPARLVWSTRDPRATYGDALVDEVEAAQPDAVIWDTTRHGKPDLVALARRASRVRRRGGARRQQQVHDLRLVHAFERRGIPAFGPIFDS